MSRRADVAVVGLGAAGSAAILALARRGIQVIGFDRYSPPHQFGSTHGRSRVIREAYYESPVYVPLVRRAYQLWEALQRDSGQRLLWQTGGLMIGRPDGQLLTGSERSARAHGLPFELLGAAEIRRRFPALRPDPGEMGLLEPRAGFLDPEVCVSSALQLAVRAGAVLDLDTEVTSWRRSGAGLALATSRGAVECGTAILSAGPWLPGLISDSVIPLEVERQVMYWFKPEHNPEMFLADRLPVFIWEWERDRLFYGIPDHGAGLKVARHHDGAVASPDRVDRTVGPVEIAAMRTLLRTRIPDAGGQPIDAATCLYTNTPDHHFVLGALPGEPRVLLASACSGHGFKFASVIGEILSDMAMGEVPAFDLKPFRPDRFASPPNPLSRGAGEGARG
ncbi:MAG TPA: N-methyl-L-tryptophan oxidase [Gemmatimonadales bacterium]